MRNSEFNSGIVVALVVVVAVCGVVVLFVTWREKRRTSLLRGFAQQNGYQFEEYQWSLPDFELFQRGRSREFRSVSVFERLGFHFALGDYQFVEGAVNRPMYRLQTVCLINCPTANRPHVVVRPKDMFDGLGKVLGGQDVQIADEDFVKLFVVQSNDPEHQVESALNSEMRDALKSMQAKRVYIEACDTYLLVHRIKKLNVAEMNTLIADSLLLANAWFGSH